MFFTVSLKRNTLIKLILKGDVKSMYETRWFKKHDRVIQIKTEIKITVDALIKISTWNEQVSAPKTRILLCTINNSEFLLSLFCLCHLLVLSLSLNCLLQKFFLMRYRCKKTQIFDNFNN